MDFDAARRWPLRAGAHVLGAGLVIAVLVALTAAPTDLDRHQLPKETVVHLAVWLAVVLVRPLPPRGVRRAALAALAALVGTALVSGIFAQNGWLAFRAGALMLTGAVAFVTARHLAASGFATTLLAWCGAAAVIGVSTGLLQAYGVTSPLFASTRIPGGTFGNRNFMAHFGVLALPLLILAALTARMRVAGWAFAGIALIAGAVILSRSRAGWIGMAAAATITLATAVIAARRGQIAPLGHRIVGAAAVLALSVAAVLVVPNHLNWRSASPYTDTLTGLTAHDEGSGRGRLLQYRNSLKLLRRHPVLGVGPGNWPIRYGDVAPASDPSWVWADVIPINPWPSSDWIALASELGILGLAAAALLGLSIIWRGIVALRSHGVAVLAGGALLGTLTALVIVGALDAVLLLATSMLLVALQVGALLQWCDGTDTTNATGASHRGNALLAVVLGVVVLRSGLQTAAYLVAGNGRALSRVVWASRIDPGSYPLRIALAQRLPCDRARADIIAAMSMAPKWPASLEAARRCGVPRRTP